MVFTGAEITAWVGSFLWPLFRIGAVVMAAPIFGAQSVPVRVRLIIAMGITSVVVPLLPPMPAIDLFNPLIVWIIIQQLLIGLALGFAIQLVFSAVITAGQVIAMQMALGFSLMVDPQNGQQVPVLSQLYVILVILVYLALNGHLVLIHILVDSFHTLPISAEGLSSNVLWQLVSWGSHIFTGAVAIALPAIASLLIVNFAFGVMTRAAPQLNIFSIGFPITMMLGFAVVWVTLPSVVPHSSILFNETHVLLQQLFTGGP